MNEEQLKRIIESVLFASGQPVDMKKFMEVFPEEGHPGEEAIKQALETLKQDYQGNSIELKQVSSGFRFQVRQDYADWVARLHEERPARYSRATLETLALIAYRQPITRAEIEEVRGVSVSSQIIKSLMEREWIRVVGHRDVPGKPALYATTKTFLDYFNLKSLEELPPLADLRDIDSINAELDLQIPGLEPETSQPAEDVEQASAEISDETSADEVNEETESEESTADSSAQVVVEEDFDEADDDSEEPVVEAEEDSADTSTEEVAEEDADEADDDSTDSEDNEQAANEDSMLMEASAPEVLH